MRVFITGATGFIGSAVVRELLGAGHEVSGLARSDDAARTLDRSGVAVIRGDLGDLASLRRGASWAEGVIHTAYVHDFVNFAESVQIDKRAIETLGEALAGSAGPLLVTSGIALVASKDVVTEKTLPPTDPNVGRASEQAADYVGTLSVNATSIRLPPTVHGEGDHGFIPALIAIARAKGVSAYVGDGRNRWPAVHRLDAAVLYRLVLEHGAPGPRYHGVAEEGVPFKEIAEVIGQRLGVPVASKTADEAGEHFGWLARFASLDCPASSRRTSEQLNWHTTQPGLLADLDQNYYFAARG